MAQSQTTHRMTCAADSLTSDDLRSFADDLGSGVRVRVNESIGQRDARTLIFEAEIDINKGRI